MDNKQMHWWGFLEKFDEHATLLTNAIVTFILGNFLLYLYQMCKRKCLPEVTFHELQAELYYSSRLYTMLEVLQSVIIERIKYIDIELQSSLSKINWDLINVEYSMAKVMPAIEQALLKQLKEKTTKLFKHQVPHLTEPEVVVTEPEVPVTAESSKKIDNSGHILLQSIERHMEGMSKEIKKKSMLPRRRIPKIVKKPITTNNALSLKVNTPEILHNTKTMVKSKSIKEIQSVNNLLSNQQPEPVNKISKLEKTKLMCSNDTLLSNDGTTSEKGKKTKKEEMKLKAFSTDNLLKGVSKIRRGSRQKKKEEENSLDKIPILKTTDFETSYMLKKKNPFLHLKEDAVQKKAIEIQDIKILNKNKKYVSSSDSIRSKGDSTDSEETTCLEKQNRKRIQSSDNLFKKGKLPNNDATKKLITGFYGDARVSPLLADKVAFEKSLDFKMVDLSSSNSGLDFLKTSSMTSFDTNSLLSDREWSQLTVFHECKSNDRYF